MRSATALRRLLRRAERAALAALAGALRAERALDAATRTPTRAAIGRADRAKARAGELARAWSTAQDEYERERVEARKAVAAVERRPLPKPVVKHRKAKK